MASKYHGKIIFGGDPLPTRSEFAEPPGDLVKASIGAGFLFHLDHIHDANTSAQGTGFTYQQYTPIWIGKVQGGTKVTLRILGIKPWFLVRVPREHAATPQLFAQEFRDAHAYRRDIPIVHRKPFKEYSADPVPYLRIESASTFARSKLIKAAQGAGYETAYDDISAYRLCTNREYNYQPCGWNTIRNVTPSAAGIIREDVLAFDVHVDDVIGLDVDFTLDAYRHLAKPPMLAASWDIETYNSENTGQAPLHDEIVAGMRIDMIGKDARVRRAQRDDRLQAIITMAAVTFAWTSDSDPFLSVVFTILPVPASPRCLIVQCRNVREVICGFAGVLRSMQIDALCAFNDGLYDWPFILSYMKYYGLEANFAATSVLAEPSAYDAKPDSVDIKLEAQQQIQQHFFSTPGWISIDTRNVFRRLMPTAEKSSLAYFLEVCKLGGKEDMPIQTMFKIFRIVRQAQLGLFHELCRRKAVLMKDVNSPGIDHTNKLAALSARADRVGRGEATYEELRAWLLRQDERAPFARGTAIVAGKSQARLGKYAPADISSYGIENFTRDEALQLFDRIGETVEYCRVDAARCHQLLLRRNVFADNRDFGNLTSTNLIDNFYRAGGMKVRNTVMQYALRPEWNLAVCNYRIVRVEKSTSKYPGAYVVPPIQSLYPSVEADAKIEAKLGITSAVRVPGTAPRIEPATVAAPPPRTPAPTFADRVAQYCSPPIRDDHSVIIGYTLEGYPIRVLSRPIYGEDYSSLYPSADMVHNLSPEMIVREEREMLRLRSKINPVTGKPYKFREIAFEYGPPGSTNKRKVRAWCVQYLAAKSVPPGGGYPQWSYAGMGIYPHILKQLFDRRAAVKKLMGAYAGPRELLDSDRVKNKWPSMVGDAPSDPYEADSTFLFGYIAARQHELEAAAAASVIPTAQGGTGEPHPFHKHKLAEHAGNAAWFRKNYTAGTLGALYEDIDYKFNYYNSKQNTLKVFMNTFYGETGNSVSPFFMVEVAGGITTAGREALHYVKSHIEANDYIPTYGDTDSLYPMSPNVIFAELDYLYFSGAIEKKIYWTRLIEITMQDADRLSAEIAKLLEAWTGTPFFKMAYEEVLWPFALWGKKTYGGIKHEGISNLAATLPGITPEEFQKHKSLFTRGIGAKKRGASPIMQLVVYEIMRNCFAITNNLTMLENVMNMLEVVRERKWSPAMFVKTAVYKLPGRKLDGTPRAGNPTVQGFIARMRDIEARYPEVGVGVPEVGCRYNYVAVCRPPCRYDMRGRRTPISTHERHEYYDSISNAAYQALPGVGELVIDIDYYITDEIIGQLTRMVCYHANFAHLTAAVESDDDDADDEAYKRADAAAQKAAKKYLTEQYTLRHPQPYADGSAAKSHFREAAKILKLRWEESYGPCGSVLRRVQNVITGTETENTDAKIIAHIRDCAATLGKADAASWWPAALRAHGRDVHRASRAVHYAAKYIRNAAAASIAATEVELRKCASDFRHACAFEVDLLQRIINRDATLDVDADNIHADIIVNVNAMYFRLYAAALTVAALEATEAAAIATRRAQNGDTTAPKHVVESISNVADAYAAWVARSGTSLKLHW